MGFFQNCRIKLTISAIRGWAHRAEKLAKMLYENPHPDSQNGAKFVSTIGGGILWAHSEAANCTDTFLLSRERYVLALCCFARALFVVCEKIAYSETANPPFTEESARAIITPHLSRLIQDTTNFSKAQADNMANATPEEHSAQMAKFGIHK